LIYWPGLTEKSFGFYTEQDNPLEQKMKLKVAVLSFATPAGLLMLAGTLIWGAPEAAIKVGVIAVIYASVMAGVAATARLTRKLQVAAVRDVFRAAVILAVGFIITVALTGHRVMNLLPPAQAAGFILLMVAYVGIFAGSAGGAYRVLRERRVCATPAPVAR
jgi:hypothetical protein